MYITLIIVLILLIIFLFFFKTMKGHCLLGKWATKIIIGKTKENERYVLNNCYFKQKGKIFQIDYIIVCDKGVFVIKIVNVSGYLYGNQKMEEWKHGLFTDKRVKYYIPNPVMENEPNCKFIQSLLGKKIKANNLVVLSQNNMQEIVEEHAVALSKFNDYLSLLPKKLTSDEIIKTVKVIKHKIYVPKKSDKIEKKKQRLYELIDIPRCPDCGYKLVIRKSGKKEFYGCSNYPRCDYIEYE